MLRTIGMIGIICSLTACERVNHIGKEPDFTLTDLIEAQRGYELNSKVISAADQMLGATTQVR